MDLIRQNKRLFIGSGLALAGLVVIALIVSAKINSSQLQCVIKNEVPIRDMLTLKNVASDDHTVLVNSAGYIQLFGSSFIELNLESVSTKRLLNITTLTLRYDCADLELDLIYAFDQYNRANTVSLKNLKWTLRGFAKSTPFYSCGIRQLMHTFNPELRFACLGRIAYYCEVSSCDKLGNHYKKPVGQIVLEPLEIEVDGDPEMIGRGEFSKRPVKDGCSSF